jgi:hypothetical protein
MTSLQTRLKQIPANDGFYITVGNCVNRFYANTGTDSLPTFDSRPLISTMSSSGAYVSSLIVNAGGIFRDMGKSVVSSGRSFRKVQLMVSTGTSLYNNGTDGVGGVDTAPTNYLTGYIELPSFGTVGGSVGTTPLNGPTPVARLG